MFGILLIDKIVVAKRKGLIFHIRLTNAYIYVCIYLCIDVHVCIYIYETSIHPISTTYFL